MNFYARFLGMENCKPEVILFQPLEGREHQDQGWRVGHAEDHRTTATPGPFRQARLCPSRFQLNQSPE